MAEAITDSIVAFFRDSMPKELIIFIISLLPVLEIRGGMIAAKILGVQLWKAFIISYIGNLLPIPFILLFIRKIFRFLRRFEKWNIIIDKLEAHSDKKKETVLKYKRLGLLILVAIPLPGTGGWTGALVAALMDIRMKSSLPIIAAGILIAGLIMAALSYGLLGAVMG